MSINQSHSRPADNAVRLSGALIGLAIFFIGVGLLYGVFQTAKTLYETPPKPLPIASPTPEPTPTPTPVTAPPGKPTPSPAPPAAPDTTSTAVSAISDSLIGFAKQWLLLLLMCIAGSVIASRGIELFFRACAASVNPGKTGPAAPVTPPNP